MTALTALSDLKPVHLDEHPRAEQRGWIDGTVPVVIQYAEAPLERTAVVRYLPEGSRPKAVIPITRLYVDEETLVWVPDRWVAALNGRYVTGGPTVRERRERGRKAAAENTATARDRKRALV